MDETLERNSFTWKVIQKAVELGLMSKETTPDRYIENIDRVCRLMQFIESHHEPGPKTAAMVSLLRSHRRAFPHSPAVHVPANLVDAMLAEHGPAKPAPRIRGDSRTGDAGRWQDLESGVET